MVLYGSDGSFGSIAAVEARRHKLVVNLFALHEVFEHIRTLVVESLELGLQSGTDEAGMAFFVRFQ
jgi:hypothetical protein